MSDNAIQLCVATAILAGLIVRRWWRPVIWFGAGALTGWIARKLLAGK